VATKVDADTLLSTFLREHLRLTGTHVGCDTAQCGACTVHVGGRAIKSCNVLAVQAQGANVVTIEGIAAADRTPTRRRSAKASKAISAAARVITTSSRPWRRAPPRWPNRRIPRWVRTN